MAKYINQLTPGQVVRLAVVAPEFKFMPWAAEMADDLFVAVNNGSAKPRSVLHLASGTLLEGPLAQGCQFSELNNRFDEHHGARAFASVGELLASLLTLPHGTHVCCGEDDVLCVELRAESGSLHFSDDHSFGACK